MEGGCAHEVMMTSLIFLGVGCSFYILIPWARNFSRLSEVTKFEYQIRFLMAIEYILIFDHLIAYFEWHPNYDFLLRDYNSVL